MAGEGLLQAVQAGSGCDLMAATGEFEASGNGQPPLPLWRL